MIFNHRVKHNGITYPAGADVPVEGKVEPKKVEVKVEEVLMDEVKPTKPKTRKTKK